jgi:hypothetical protein
MTTKEFLEDEKKHKEVLVKASILGAFDQTVNHIIYKIRAMKKLSDSEIEDIRLWLNMAFIPTNFTIKERDMSEPKHIPPLQSLEDIENIESI